MAVVQDLLRQFEEGSGLIINTQKPVIVFSKNVPTPLHEELANILGVPMVAKHEKSSSLPIVGGKSKLEIFDSLKDRVLQKLQSWMTKKLSQVGHEVLIKLVIQAISSYAMTYSKIMDAYSASLGACLQTFLAPRLYMKNPLALLGNIAPKEE
ncbi:UNVERIFIED_CONTAM: hypothetical protein Sindi_0542800 [Sesamum indicum]